MEISNKAIALIAFLLVCVFAAADQNVSGALERLWDGTNVIAVKGSGAAPATTDNSLVVAVSPNGDPCASPSVVKLSQPISLASTTATAVVALTSGQTISVCGAAFTLAGTSPTALFTSAATCGTSPTNLTGTMAPVTGTELTIGYGGHTAFSNTSGQNLCLTLAGTSPSAQGVITYVKR